MKRLFALLIILVTIVCSLSAADDYSFPFTLVLKRNGTDSVWFTKSATDKETDKISLHIFPIISASSTTTSSVESTVYLHWLKQSSNKVKIKITFVGNEEKGDDSTTFMMWCASEKDDSENEDKGINFNVVIKDADNKEIGSLTFDSAAGRLTKRVMRRGVSPLIQRRLQQRMKVPALHIRLLSRLR